MTLRLNGSTSGYTEIDAPAVAGSNTLVLPTGNGSSGQFLQTNGSGTLSFASAVVNGSSSAIVSGTAQASTSGTAIDFTGIPSWAKRVTVMFAGVSTNGSSAFQVQLGTSSGIETTGYNAVAGVVTGAYVGAAGAAAATTGFVLEYNSQGAAFLMSGHLLLTTISSNTWVGSGIIGNSSGGHVFLFSGNKATAGTLDRVRITTVTGTNTFDAGSINILYE
jgi:hypothetical protein